MVDAKEQPAVVRVPFREALTCGKGQHFERVAVGIVEIERLDPPGIWIPVRQTLRATRGVRDFETS